MCLWTNDDDPRIEYALIAYIEPICPFKVSYAVTGI